MWLKGAHFGSGDRKQWGGKKQERERGIGLMEECMLQPEGIGLEMLKAAEGMRKVLK